MGCGGVSRRIAGAPLGPAGWLRADRLVVEFTGREAELAELRTWCEQGSGGPVRVLVGAGGVGKSRLALQVASEWAATGAVWGMIAAEPGGWGASGRARGNLCPVLLIVDYAETRTGLPELLVRCWMIRASRGCCL